MRVQFLKSDATVCGKYLVFRDRFPSITPEIRYYVVPDLYDKEIFGRTELGHLSQYTVRGGKVSKNMYFKQGIPPSMKEAVDLALALSVMDA